MWYDIHQPEWINYNEYSLRDLKEHGINPDDTDGVIRRSNEKYYEFFQKTSDLVMKHNPHASLYFNGTTRTYNDENISLFKFNFQQYNTKHDLEDLPTAWGGYDIFPWRSKYFSNTGKEIIAMSGKFHKAWGEFGGFKDKEALRYEAASMIAFGANANFGDQLHPSGVMDMATYENIGYAYEYIEKIEAYGIGGKNISETGLYTSESKAAIEGTVNMLLENQVNFNVVNTLPDWSDIKVLIITSGGVLEEDIPKVQTFADRGGKIIVMGEGLFVNGEPIIDIGADYIGKARYDVDYTLAEEELSKGIVPSPFLNYRAGIRVKPSINTEVLARIREPYFSRTLEHYSSHKNTPYQLEDADYPAVIKNGNIIFLAHDLDKQYFEEGSRLQRDLFINALNLIRTKPMIEAEMPSMGRINLLKQEEKNRYVLHLLYASPIQRGSVKVIEELVPIYNIPVYINLEQKIKKAYLIPSGEKLKIKKQDGKLTLLVPELKCHTGIVMEY